jgi:aminoglycoside phosphotransferase family enzyme/predicted kinase
MQTEDQSAIVEFLSQPSTYGGAAVERVETHASVVFLAGQRAYKLKRAVRFDYLDFSSASRRQEMCDAEVRLNRRTAPTLYRGVVAVTRGAGGDLALGGDGEPIDWLVEMNRFDQDQLLDRLAVAGRLDLGVMPALASALARFHNGAERRTDLGGKAGMAWVIEGNADGVAEFGRHWLDASTVSRLTNDSWTVLDACGDILERRRESGFVRQCHGDLHLRNIVLLDGEPTLFDGVEFNDQISCTDVFYDLAFLLMDLWRRHLPRHANAVLNRYLTETGDLEGVRLLPLFLSCRAAVRAKTSATAAAQAQGDGPRRSELQATAQEYLAMAMRLLHPPRPSLVAVGGLSGTGKSTLAHMLAPDVGAAPGAVVLRSDEIRKQLAGTSMFQRLGLDGYSAEMSERVYHALVERAAHVLRCGHSVIVDAVFARPSDRTRIEQVADAESVPFTGIWLEAPESVLIARTGQRRNDASDADPEVVRMQRQLDTGSIEWMRLDTSASVSTVLSHAIERVCAAIFPSSSEKSASTPAS